MINLYIRFSNLYFQIRYIFLCFYNILEDLSIALKVYLFIFYVYNIDYIYNIYIYTFCLMQIIDSITSSRDRNMSTFAF